MRPLQCILQPFQNWLKTWLSGFSLDDKCNIVTLWQCEWLSLNLAPRKWHAVIWQSTELQNICFCSAPVTSQFAIFTSSTSNIRYKCNNVTSQVNTVGCLASQYLYVGILIWNINEQTIKIQTCRHISGEVQKVKWLKCWITPCWTHTTNQLLNNNSSCNGFGGSTVAVFLTGHMGIVFETGRSDVFSLRGKSSMQMKSAPWEFVFH